ncbi:MAG: DNA mismatch repair endonuclease MutL [Clostridia bacterium]|nr:DNA mismatch repair endonuclease MutL [Clostridia bacterium]MBQ1995025.1 DNA mismatch repair endonuclease MutL [Clostridia bacterium]
MAKINILSKHMAELIAAGEVVERPASVVKELMENSIDAGATSITVEIKNGGVSYIRITDNGCGIEKEDVPKAFLSHATSKLKNETDLNSIFTLGFRGEALASVAAVSRVQLLTKTENEVSGTAFVIEGGTEKSLEQAGCPNGTTIIVRDLFYNTPARMKFLKRDVSEANAVAEVVDRIALSHPEISIRFIREGRQVLITPGDGKLISTIYSVFGKVFAESLLEVNYELDGIKIEGYVCKPVCARPSRSMQYFFLNNRYFKSRSCMASMENAYKNAIMVGKFPSCVLNIKLRPDFVDVNVHPAKTEVRFGDERKVTSALYFAVKTALETFDTPVQVDLSKVNKVTEKAIEKGVQLQMVEDDTPNNKSAQVFRPRPQTEVSASAVKTEVKAEIKPEVRNTVKVEPKPDFFKTMPASEFKAKVAAPKSEPVVRRDEKEPDLIAAFRNKKKQEAEMPKAEAAPAVKVEASEVNIQPEAKSEPTVKIIEEPKEKQPKPLRLLGEAFKTYIICEYDNRVCLIDKHAAHERIIFNRMKEEARSKKASQVLLKPVTVTLSKNEYSTVIDNLSVFSEAGYLVEDFGSGTVIVRECPMAVSGDDIEDTVIEIATYLTENRTDVEAEKIDRILHTSACKAAIKAGYKNSTAEMKVLAEQVLYTNEIRYCPHGRPVLIEISKYELEKQFGRIQ